MHILLVEDDPFIAKAVCAALESEAHAVTWTPTGREGLAVIATGTPDAVLLDLGLPGMDGIDVLKSIRAMTKPLCDTPVIIVTAREALESRLEGLDAGADDYILKPFHMSELIARLRAVVRRRSPLAPDVLRAGSLSLNTVTHACSVGSESVTLSKREYARHAQQARVRAACGPHDATGRHPLEARPRREALCAGRRAREQCSRIPDPLASQEDRRFGH